MLSVEPGCLTQKHSPTTYTYSAPGTQGNCIRLSLYPSLRFPRTTPAVRLVAVHETPPMLTVERKTFFPTLTKASCELLTDGEKTKYSMTRKDKTKKKARPKKNEI